MERPSGAQRGDESLFARRSAGARRPFATSSMPDVALARRAFDRLGDGEERDAIRSGENSRSPIAAAIERLLRRQRRRLRGDGQLPQAQRWRERSSS